MEDFKRPDHPDFKDSSELAKEGFSGIRHNSISNYMEMWLCGVKKFEMPVLEYQLNPQKWAEEYEELFALKHVEVITNKGN